MSTTFLQFIYCVHTYVGVYEEQVNYIRIEKLVKLSECCWSLGSMKQHFQEVMLELQQDTDLLQTLLRSMKSLLDACDAANGGPTRY